MTETMIDLPGMIAKSDDTDFLRELIQDAAQRLMDIEVAAVCGAGHASAARTGRTSATAKPRQPATCKADQVGFRTYAISGRLRMH